MRSISNRFFYAILVLLNVFAAGSICAQQYRPIATWPDETNACIEEFLNTTLTVTDRVRLRRYGVRTGSLLSGRRGVV